MNSRQRIRIAVLFLVFRSAVASADTTPVAIPARSVPVEYGFYPIRLYDLSPEKNLFSADFYFWVSVPTNSPFFTNTPLFEAANGEKLDFEGVPYNPVDVIGTNTYWYRYRSRFYHTFNFGLYPFDCQTLSIKLESPEWQESKFHFEPINASHLDSAFSNMVRRFNSGFPDIAGWKVSWVQTYSTNHLYDSDWGFPMAQGLSKYSQAILEIHLRHRWGLPLLALLGPNILSALLGILATGSKGGTQALLGIVAATAAQHYAFASNAPGMSILRFAQVYFLITYAVLGLCFWFSLTREGPLPTRYVWRWFVAHLGMTLLALGIQVICAAQLS